MDTIWIVIICLGIAFVIAVIFKDDDDDKKGGGGNKSDNFPYGAFE